MPEFERLYNFYVSSFFSKYCRSFLHSFICCRRTSHWNSGMVMQDRATHTKRMPKFCPTTKKSISAKQKTKTGKRKRHTIIFYAKQYGANRCRDVIERHSVAVSEYGRKNLKGQKGDRD